MHEDAQWCALLSQLPSRVFCWVCSANIADWYGQEHDVAADLSAATFKKVLEFLEKARAEDIPVKSLPGLCFITARRLFLDALPKASRLVRGETAFRSLEGLPGSALVSNVEEEVVERLYEEYVFQQVAKLVRSFPPKERLALLTDIAIRIQKQGDFDGQPTPLRQAFIDAGIFLEDYLPPVDETSLMRSRRASLASLGYKHIAQYVRV